MYINTILTFTLNRISNRGLIKDSRIAIHDKPTHLKLSKRYILLTLGKKSYIPYTNALFTLHVM